MLSMLLLCTMLLTTLTFVSCGEEKVEAELIDINLTEESYAFGVSKEQPELLEKANDLIKEIKNTGTLDEICDHYFGDGVPEPVETAELDTSKDQLIVATHVYFAPFEYKVGDKYYGIDLEIAALLADKMNQELVIKEVEFKDLMTTVYNGEADIIMSGFTLKEERKEYVDFTDTYYEASQKLIIRNDEEAFKKCKTADDVLEVLRSMTMSTTIGYLNGTTGGMYVNNEGDYKGNKLKVTGAGYQTGALAVEDLMKGRIRGVVLDGGPAESLVREFNAMH